MRIPIYQIDAFATELFSGNPAAVVITDEELPVGLMQSIASENNLADTAFVYGEITAPFIRWFTPTVEVDLCGHATLAAAHVVRAHLLPDMSRLSFSSKSGPLHVFSGDGLLWLDFPADRLVAADDLRPRVEAAIGCSAEAVFKGRDDIMVVLPCEAAVADLSPDLHLVSMLECRGAIVTSRSNDVDFVSRFFAPQLGIDEDSVTGSAHTSLTPYWSDIFGKDDLLAVQLSARRGMLHCRNAGDRVHIGGNAITYLEGHINIKASQQ